MSNSGGRFRKYPCDCRRTCTKNTKFGARGQIVLTIGGPVWFDSFKAQVPKGSLAKTTMSPSFQMLKEERYDLADDRSPPDPTNIIKYRDVNRGRTMEVKVYQLREGEYHQLLMTRSRLEVDSGPKFEGEENLSQLIMLLLSCKIYPLIGHQGLLRSWPPSAYSMKTKVVEVSGLHWQNCPLQKIYTTTSESSLRASKRQAKCGRAFSLLSLRNQTQF